MEDYHEALIPDMFMEEVEAEEQHSVKPPEQDLSPRDHSLLARLDVHVTSEIPLETIIVLINYFIFSIVV